MVVYTPDQALNPEKKEFGDDTGGVDIEIQMEKAALTSNESQEDGNDEYLTGSVYKGTTVPVVRERRLNKQRRRLWVQLMLIFGMLSGLSLCILGSIHLYRGMTSVSFRGRCGVGIVDMTVFNATSSEPLAQKTTAEKEKVRKCGVEYYEDVEIKGQVETLKVPAVNKSSPATFRHDFSQNMSAVRDDALNFCFLVPFLKDFETARVPSPQQFSNTLNQEMTETERHLVYQQQAQFKVGSLIEDVLNDFGDSLAELCKGAKSYRTEPVAVLDSTDLVPLYEVETTAAPFETTTAAVPIDMWYSMYPGGNALFSYHLIMLDDMLNDDF